MTAGYIIDWLVALLAFFVLISVSIHILATRDYTSDAFAWLGMVWLVPGLGVILYFLFGQNRIRRKALRAKRRMGLGGEVGLIRSDPLIAGTALKADQQTNQAKAAPNAAHTGASGLVSGFAPDHTQGGSETIEQLLHGQNPYHVQDITGLPAAQFFVPHARLGNRLISNPLTSHNWAEMYTTGRAAFDAMISAIDAAENTIALTTYIFQTDQAGRRMANALLKAKERGVDIRILIDAVGNMYGLRPISPLLRRMGFKVAVFNPLRLGPKLAFFNLRTHRKILIVDGQIGFTGGMNIRAHHLVGKKADPWWAKWKRKNISQTPDLEPDHLQKTLKDSYFSAVKPITDRHFRLHGPVVSQMFDAFAEDWLYASGESLDDSWWPENTTAPKTNTTAQIGASSGQHRRPKRAAPNAANQPERTGAALANSQGIACRALADGPDKAVPETRAVILSAFTSAQSEILIRTPYFLPDRELKAALIRAALRGVRVSVLLPERSNIPLFDLVMRANLDGLSAAGVRIYLTPEPFDHSKTMAIDRYWCLIGSSNMDARSLRLNFEFNIECFGESLASLLADDMRERTLISRPYTSQDLANRTLFERAVGRVLWLFTPYL